LAISFCLCRKEKKKKNAGSKPTLYINEGKGDTLAQSAVSLPHQKHLVVQRQGC